MPRSLPRAYLVAGTLEPFFMQNAKRWAAALSDAGADVVMSERIGSDRTADPQAQCLHGNTVRCAEADGSAVSAERGLD